MRKIFTLLLMGASLLPALAQIPGDATDDKSRTIYNVFDMAVFHDGYKTDAIVEAGNMDGVICHSNSLYAKKLDMSEMKGNLSKLQLEVLVGALCDNYDRMGRVNVAFVPKGIDTYNPDETDRIEIARFITPFMNKNKLPNVVPYVYEIGDLTHLFGNHAILEKYDLWLETEIFGIPYSANQMIKGCADRTDVFNATVSFTFPAASGEDPIPGILQRDDFATGNQTASHILKTKEPLSESYVLPIYITKSELLGDVNFNNYKTEATDTLGVTTRIFKYIVDKDMQDAEIVMILTNHGAEEGGEEYERRRHLVYIDGEIALAYTPGGVSCEPYRQYNTQKNALFDESRDDEFWEEISNWCPGQAAPIRRIALGAVEKGEHEIMIRVPDAEFVGQSGDFRPSLYLIGVSYGKLDPSGVNISAEDALPVRIVREGDLIKIEGEADIHELCVYSFDGRLMEGHYNSARRLSLEDYPAGQYIIVASDYSGRSALLKFIK